VLYPTNDKLCGVYVSGASIHFLLYPNGLVVGPSRTFFPVSSTNTVFKAIP